MSRRLVRCLSLALLCAALPSCMAVGAEYRELKVSGWSGAEVWREINKFATNNGFRVDAEETDIGRKTFQTRWSGGSYGFRRGVGRTRFHAVIAPLEEGVADWLVRYYCELQRVDDTSKVMRPEEDDWETVGNYNPTERIFATAMRIAIKARRETDADGDAASRSGR